VRGRDYPGPFFDERTLDDGRFKHKVRHWFWIVIPRYLNYKSLDWRVPSLSDCLNHFVSETFPEGTILRTCGNKIMSGKIILLLVALAALSSAAVALTVAQSELGSFAAARNYPTKADFDRTFSEFADTAPFDSESAAANREKLRAVGLTRINSAQFGEE
jgi:hypothetical protein